MHINSLSWRFVSLWGCLTLALGLFGCGSRTDGLITISGTVTLDGKPVPEGSVSLMPLDGKGIAGGGTIAHGRYSADSSPGLMAVQINGIEKVEKENPSAEEVARGLHIDQKQILPASYNRQSQLRIEVSSDNHQFDFNLTSDGAIPEGMGTQGSGKRAGT
ncbi:MAG: hypothetical protein WD045_06055 [Pirellulaceae bacterium]